MRRALALALLAAVVPMASCQSAIRHPAITAGVVGGVMGLGTCALGAGDLQPCAIVGGVAAAALGGITGLVLLLVGDEDTRTVLDDNSGGQPLREPHPIRMLDPDDIPPDALPAPVDAPPADSPAAPTDATIP